MSELTLSSGGRRYGAFRSAFKINDNGFPAHLVQRTGEFPVRAVVSGKIGARRDQKQFGMCTGEGSTNMGRRLYSVFRGVDVTFAPEFTYALERLREGTFDQGDTGAQVLTSLEVPDPAMNDVNCVGWCPVDVEGYVPYDIKSKPSQAQLDAAKQFPGGAHHNIGNNIHNIKACILSKSGDVTGFTGVIGISVYESFESDEAAASGLIPFPNLNSEQQVGGHEMHSLLAYDDTIQCPNSPNPGAVLTENSWGPEWGCSAPAFAATLTEGKGLCWISYDYLMNPNLASDIRMGHLGKAWA